MPHVLRQNQRIATVIAGTGKYVPDKVMTSDYIEEKLGFGSRFSVSPFLVRRTSSNHTVPGL